MEPGGHRSEGDLSGPQGASGVTQAVTPGKGYVLSETGGTDALADLSTYTQKGAWSCTGGSLTGGNTISIPFTTAAVTCTVTNETARLVLKKIVTNTHGGSAQPKDFTLTAMPTGGETLEKSVVGSAAAGEHLGASRHLLRVVGERPRRLLAGVVDL